MAKSPGFRLMGIKFAFEFESPSIVNAIKDIKEQMVTREQLVDAIGALGDTLSNEVVQIKDVVSALEAKVAELSIPADFSAEFEKLAAIGANLEAIVPSAPEAPVSEDLVIEALETDPAQVDPSAPAEEPAADLV